MEMSVPQETKHRFQGGESRVEGGVAHRRGSREAREGENDRIGNCVLILEIQKY